MPRIPGGNDPRPAPSLIQFAKRRPPSQMIVWPLMKLLSRTEPRAFAQAPRSGEEKKISCRGDDRGCFLTRKPDHRVPAGDARVDGGGARFGFLRIASGRLRVRFPSGPSGPVAQWQSTTKAEPPDPRHRHGILQTRRPPAWSRGWRSCCDAAWGSIKPPTGASCGINHPK